MSIPTDSRVTKVADGVYDITGNRGSKNEGIEKKKAEFKPYATGLVKSQINESIKNRQVRPDQVPLLNLNNLPSNDSDLNKLEGSQLIAELEARESLAGNQTLFKESKVTNIDTKNFFGEQEFNELYSEEDEVTKKVLEDLNSTLKKDDTKKT
jgi:hypothetical protein